MGQPAAVQGDAIMGTCVGHMIPGAAGAPAPAPPMPFNAPLMMGLEMSVLIGGKPAAVMGSSGFNQPPHVGLHPSDPYLVPTAQEGKVTVGSATVMFGGAAAAHMGSMAMIDFGIPGNIMASAVDVLIGG